MNATTLRKRLDRQKGYCTWCGGPVGKGRRTWCSQSCVNAFREAHDWMHIRGKVLDRDRGVCSMCGCDCERITRLVGLVRWGGDGWESFRHMQSFYRSLGFDRLYGMDLWQADHIVPRVRGGGNELTNLRTLCVPCHKGETARLAADRAAERRRSERNAK